MIYPEFLKRNDLIGICAPSAGAGDKLEAFDASELRLMEEGYRILETEHVRVDGPRGGTREERGEELSFLFEHPEVKAVFAARGGDFLSEILPYVRWTSLKKNPKWLAGASDPTSLLFTYTVKYGVATMYGFNGGSFDEDPLPEYLQNSLKLIRGRKVIQRTSDYHASKPSFADDYCGPDTITEWKSNRDSFHVSGRCIGGCIDVLKDLIGTPYDAVRKFILTYLEDGFIWYFDNFSMTAENFYRTLLQMKYAGWFSKTKAILIGRVLFPSSETGMTYEDAVTLALGEYPFILEADIGHTVPSFTMINGSIATLTYKNGKGRISFDLK